MGHEIYPHPHFEIGWGVEKGVFGGLQTEDAADEVADLVEGALVLLFGMAVGMCSSLS